MKIKWVVGVKPTGPFRSFSKRSWPSGFIGPNHNSAFFITCEDEYVPAKVKSGQHGELKVGVAIYGVDGRFVWRNFKKRFATLKEAKDYAQEHVNKNIEEYEEISKSVVKN